MAPTDTMMVEGHYCWARMKLPALHVVFLDTTPLQLRECVCVIFFGGGAPHHSQLRLYAQSSYLVFGDRLGGGTTAFSMVAGLELSLLKCVLCFVLSVLLGCPYVPILCLKTEDFLGPSLHHWCFCIADFSTRSGLCEAKRKPSKLTNTLFFRLTFLASLLFSHHFSPLYSAMYIV